MNNHLIVSYYFIARNRLLEEQYRLPSSRDGKLRTLGISEREMAVMRQRDSLELPSNFVREVRHTENTAATKYPKYIQFQGFKLSTKFPNNVCMLKKGKVIVCTDIVENPEDPFNPKITAHVFTKRLSAFDDNVGNSAEIELFTVSQINQIPDTFSASDIHSKCFISPDFKCFCVVADKEFVDPLVSVRAARAAAEDDEKHREFMETFLNRRSRMKWTVQCLELRKSS